MKYFFNILHIWWDELMDVLHDRGILIFILFVPIFYPVLYAYVYTNEVVRKVPTAVVDESNSYLSRKFVRQVDATPDVKAISCPDMIQAQDLVKRQKAYGIIRIPSTFTEDLYRGDQTYIGFYGDMSGMLYYKGIFMTLSNVSLSMNNQIKIQRYIHGTTHREDEINMLPIDYEEVYMFNASNGFACFLVPAVFMLIFQQTLLLGIGMSMGRKRENNRGCIIPLRREYKNAVCIVLGKALVYFLLYFVMAIYTISVVNKSFSLIHIGQYGDLLVFLSLYILSCTFFAMTFSAFVYRREDCIMLFVFLSVPLLFLSGISWPTSAMPAFWKYVSYLFPSTFGINGYVRINSMGATLDDVSPEYHGLWIQIGIYFLTSCSLYRLQIFRLLRRIKGRKKTANRLTREKSILR